MPRDLKRENAEAGDLLARLVSLTEGQNPNLLAAVVSTWLVELAQEGGLTWDDFVLKLRVQWCYRADRKGWGNSSDFD